MNYELSQHEKMFKHTGLWAGDNVVNERTKETGVLYLSSVGYACVKMIDGRAIIWDGEWVREIVRKADEKAAPTP